jgi:hypothetical protein
VFDGAYSADADYNPAFAVTTGANYGANIGQLGFLGFSAGFASSYDSFEFKAKGLSNDVIRVKFLDGGDYYDVTLTAGGVSKALGNDWYQVSIPMTSLTGVDAATGVLFETDNASSTEFTFLLTDIGFSNSGSGLSGELTTNGDFEAGDLTAWTEFANGGTISADNTEGSWSGKLVAGTAQSPLIKQANLVAGEITAGETVTISFDMKGSLTGAGGVVFAEFFSEFAGGGATNEILSGGPLFPTTNWVNYSYTTTTGSDVGGGITLQLKAACGADACNVTAYFDNVSVTLGGGG